MITSCALLKKKRADYCWCIALYIQTDEHVYKYTECLFEKVQEGGGEDERITT